MAAETIRLTGNVVLGTAGELYERLQSAARAVEVDRLVLDFADVERFDASGAVAVQCGERALLAAGKQLELRNLSGRQRAVLAMTPLATREVQAPPRVSLLEWVGDAALRGGDHARCFGRLLRDAGRAAGDVLTRRRRLPEGSLVEQLSLIGTDAVPIVALLGLLLGLILGVQAVEQLSKYGAEAFAADLVGLSLVRELGPMLTAIVVIGRSGAAIASELGTMQVNHEVDALRTMGIDPVRFLVLPRMSGLLIAQPPLTLLAMFTGVMGGMAVTALTADISPVAYVNRTIAAIAVPDVALGLSKSAVYAVVIGVTASGLGLDLRGGASEVGRATTTAVVVMILLIVVTDFAFGAVNALVGAP